MTKMIIIGLTGGIGMGKSTAARIFKRMGVPIYSADTSVHELLDTGGAAVRAVGRLFPDALQNQKIDRVRLGKMVFGHPKKLRALEAILHPRLQKFEMKFLKDAKRKKKSAVVLEIPLLFETGADKRCDVTISVTATKKMQQQRVLKRPRMTKQRFRSILERQMSDKERKMRADYVVRTDISLAETTQHLRSILRSLLERN